MDYSSFATSSQFARAGGNAPVLIDMPVIAGPAEIGATLNVTPGVWGGADAIAYQWLRNQASIEGAGSATYVPTPEDDGTTLGCRVTASNEDGSVSIVAVAGPVAYAAPVAVSALPDRALEAGTGVLTHDATLHFEGSNLTWSVTGQPGLTIDGTGLLRFDTDVLAEQADTEITVTATNSGGVATARFILTVAADIPADPPDVVVTGNATAAAAFGALTLAGAGGLAAPAGATSITDAGGTGLVLSGGKVVPATDGVTAGTVTFGNGTRWAVTAAADEYSAASVAEMEAAYAATALTDTRTIRLRDGDYSAEADVVTLDRQHSGRITIVAEGFRTAVLPPLVVTAANLRLSRMAVRETEDFSADRTTRSATISYSNSTGFEMFDCLVEGWPFDALAGGPLSDHIARCKPCIYTSGSSSTSGTHFRNLTTRWGDTGVYVQNGLFEGLQCLEYARRALVLVGSAGGVTIRDTRSAGPVTYGGGRGYVGPNNPNGWSARITLDTVAGMNVGNAIVVPGGSGAGGTGTIRQISGLDVDVSGLPSGGEKNQTVGGTVTNTTTGATAVITATRSYYPKDSHDPHQSVGLSYVPTPGSTLSDITIEGDIHVPSRWRWETIGDYPGGSPRLGAFDDASVTTDGGRARHNIWVTGAGDGTLYGLKDYLFDRNSYITCGDAATRTVTVDQVAGFTIGALLTAQSGATFRIMDKSASSLTLAGYGDIVAGEALTDDRGGAAVATADMSTGTTVASLRTQGFSGTTLVADNQMALLLQGGAALPDFGHFHNNVPLDRCREAIPNPAIAGLGAVRVPTAEDILTALVPSETHVYARNRRVGALGGGTYTPATGHGTPDYTPGAVTTPIPAKPVSSRAVGTVPARVRMTNGVTLRSPTDATIGWAQPRTFAIGFEVLDDATGSYVFSASGANVMLERRTGGLFRVKVEAVDGSSAFYATFDRPMIPEAGFVNMAVTIDPAAGIMDILWNGAQVSVWSSITNMLGAATIADPSVLYIGATPTGGSPLPMTLGYFWADDTAFDFHDPDDIARFHAADGNPAPFGADGSGPTGAAPRIFLTGPAATFHQNLGTGADWTVTGGSLTDVSGGGGTPAYTPQAVTFPSGAYAGPLGLTTGNDLVIAARLELVQTTADVFVAGDTTSNTDVQWKASTRLVTARIETTQGLATTLSSTTKLTQVGDTASILVRARLIDAATASYELWINGVLEASATTPVGDPGIRDIKMPAYIGSHTGATGANGLKLIGGIWIANTGAATLGYGDFFDGAHQPVFQAATINGVTARFFQNTAAGFKAGTNLGADAGFAMVGTVV